MMRISFFFCLVLVAVCAANTRYVPSPRIVGGHSIPITEAPYQVSLMYEGTHICGGSIIAPTMILTAAHCTIYRKEQYMNIRVGSSYSWSDGIVYNVTKVYQHPHYDYATEDYDASILVLNDKITESEKVQIISLGSITPAYKDKVDVTGWGALEANGVFWPVLQKVKVETMDWEECQSIYQSLKKTVTPRMFCAGGNGKHDSCKGDSGGPAVVKGTLVGIVSWGLGCGQKNVPGVYTAISEVAPWIRKVIYK